MDVGLRARIRCIIGRTLSMNISICLHSSTANVRLTGDADPSRDSTLIGWDGPRPF